MNNDTKIPTKEKRPPKNPILCPHCKSDNLAFVSAIRKAHRLRFLQLLAIAATIVFLLVYFTGDLSDTGSLVVAAFFGIFALILQLIISYNESRTHVECICKDCGHTWLHN